MEIDTSDRKAALYDAAYLAMVIGFAFLALLLPPFGIALGTVLIIGACHPRTKWVGKMCLFVSIGAIVIVSAIVGTVIAMRESDDSSESADSDPTSQPPPAGRSMPRRP